MASKGVHGKLTVSDLTKHIRIIMKSAGRVIRSVSTPERVVFDDFELLENRFSGVEYEDNVLRVSSHIDKELMGFIARREAFRLVISRSLWGLDEIHDLAWFYGYLCEAKDNRSRVLDWWERSSKSRRLASGLEYAPRFYLPLELYAGRKTPILILTTVLEDYWRMGEYSFERYFEILFLYHSMVNPTLRDDEYRMLSIFLRDPSASLHEVASRIGKNVSQASKKRKKLERLGIIASRSLVNYGMLKLRAAYLIAVGKHSAEIGRLFSMFPFTFHVHRCLTRRGVVVSLLAPQECIVSLERFIRGLGEANDEIVFVRPDRMVFSVVDSSVLDDVTSLFRMYRGFSSRSFSLEKPAEDYPSHRKIKRSYLEIAQLVEDMGRASLTRVEREYGSSGKDKLTILKSIGLIMGGYMPSGYGVGAPIYILFKTGDEDEACKIAGFMSNIVSSISMTVRGTVSGVLSLCYVPHDRVYRLMRVLSMLFEEKLEYFLPVYEAGEVTWKIPVELWDEEAQEFAFENSMEKLLNNLSQLLKS